MSKEYVSTRDPDQERHSYDESLIQGLAPDGGLFVPSSIPRLSEGQIKTLLGLPYTQMFAGVKELFSYHDTKILEEISRRAYDLNRFPHQSDGVVTPLRPVGNTGISIQHLSFGPTAAFKDMALQPFGQEISRVLAERGDTLDILGATSGDTGSAAEAAVKGLERVRIAMLSPLSGMSKFQRAQMGVLSGGNVLNISLKGNFDDAQRIVKELKGQPEFADLGAVNSINWARISSQIAYYFSGYAQVLQQSNLKFGDKIDFVIPSGNFGNILAGYYARAMGLPIRNLVAATNENDVLHKLIQYGEYKKVESSVTDSPSMDIAEASNVERVYYDLAGGDPTLVAEAMRQYLESGVMDLGYLGVVKSAMRTVAGLNSFRTSKADREQAMRITKDSGAGFIDPHTAAGMAVAYKLVAQSDDETPVVVLETALPVKFEDRIQEVHGEIPDRDPRFKGIDEKDMKDQFVVVKPSVEAVAEVLRDNWERAA